MWPVSRESVKMASPLQKQIYARTLFATQIQAYHAHAGDNLPHSNT